MNCYAVQPTPNNFQPSFTFTCCTSNGRMNERVVFYCSFENYRFTHYVIIIIIIRHTRKRTSFTHNNKRQYLQLNLSQVNNNWIFFKNEKWVFVVSPMNEQTTKDNNVHNFALNLRTMSIEHCCVHSSQNNTRTEFIYIFTRQEEIEETQYTTIRSTIFFFSFLHSNGTSTISIRTKWKRSANAEIVAVLLFGPVGKKENE